MRTQLITPTQPQGTLWKNLASVAAIIAVFLSVSAQAGPPAASDSKSVAPAPPPPPEVYGTGWYGGILLGANVYQENRGTRTFTNGDGDTLTISPKSDPGFVGGVKLGYIFLLCRNPRS